MTNSTLNTVYNNIIKTVFYISAAAFVCNQMISNADASRVTPYTTKPKNPAGTQNYNTDTTATHSGNGQNMIYDSSSTILNALRSIVGNIVGGEF